jgi:hypothetical protein
MPEFTIRNKSTRPILTLKAPVLQALLAARPESSSLVLAKHRQDYKRLTGKDIELDHDQQLELLGRYGADAAGNWTSAYAHLESPWYSVERTFVAGFLARSTSRGFGEDLELAEAFYDLLDCKLGKLER